MRGLIVYLLLAVFAYGQKVPDVLVFSVDSFSLKSIRRNEASEINFVIKIRTGWHVFSNEIRTGYLIPTKLNLRLPEDVALEEIHYPQGVKKTFFDVTEPLYEGTVVIPVVLKVKSGGKKAVEAALRYQACNDRLCLAPAEKKITFELPEGRAALPFVPGGEGRGLAAVLFFLFLSGILLNLTPCVYPVVPITLSFFAGQSASSRGRTALLASCYVLGIAATYSTLGVLAALSGSIMGSALQHPAVLGGVSALFVILALSLFGLYEIRVPAFLSALGIGRRGAAGAFMMGLIVGIVAAPCVGPVTAGLLLHVAERQEVLAGFLYFFTLSLGLGAPYFVLAFFSVRLSMLPGSGGWMVWIRKMFGFVLLLLAAYYARPLLPGRGPFILFSLLLSAAALYLGFLEKSAKGRFPVFVRFQRVFGICLLAASIIYFTGEWRKGSAAPAGVTTGTDISFAEYIRLKAAGSPFIIDFRADWCAPCRQFEEKVLTDPEVRKALERLPVYTVDVTRSDDRAAQEMAARFRIAGVPTLVFVDRAGREKERVTEYIDSKRFLEKLGNLAGEESP